VLRFYQFYTQFFSHQLLLVNLRSKLHLALPDHIQLLPDNIANQIAAGEVIQRPASAVKELLENAVDAGATAVQLIIQDAGKALVQVIDNGSGMSETDARMAFERHATSKITHIEDLFKIKTMGFRGEALASIAAVAQVELKTRRAEETIGNYIVIENSVVQLQELVATPVGTSIAMKNIFFNVPARRNFLKSNAVEMRHIVDEFVRVSLAFPNVFFSLTANNNQVFYLEKGSLKQRIVQLMGNTYQTKLVTVKEETDYLTINGFVGKPETAKKTRGDQYFFVNHRFIKSAYLNHAVTSAYKDLMAKDSFPSFVLFIDLDPAQIDINVHPTKQEIKFEDEKIVYAFVQAAIKHALAQFSVTPALTFDLDANIQQLDAVTQPFTESKQATATASNLFKNFTEKNQAHFIGATEKSNLKHWKDFYEPPSGTTSNKFESLLHQVRPNENLYFNDPSLNDENKFQLLEDAPLIQLQATYIVAPTQQGFLLVHQQWAHQRVLYEKFMRALSGKPIAIQQSLFPVSIQFSTQDALIIQSLLLDLKLLGYWIERAGNNSFVLQGTPAELDQGNEKMAIEKLLEQYKHFNTELSYSAQEKLARAMAAQQCIKPGTFLTLPAMQALVEQLLACASPNLTVFGAATYVAFNKNYLEKLFSKA
jgi:DNA mismatch repair protein MutL